MPQITWSARDNTLCRGGDTRHVARCSPHGSRERGGARARGERPPARTYSSQRGVVICARNSVSPAVRAIGPNGAEPRARASASRRKGKLAPKTRPTTLQEGLYKFSKRFRGSARVRRPRAAKRCNRCCPERVADSVDMTEVSETEHHNRNGFACSLWRRGPAASPEGPPVNTNA